MELLELHPGVWGKPLCAWCSLQNCLPIVWHQRKWNGLSSWIDNLYLTENILGQPWRICGNPLENNTPSENPFLLRLWLRETLLWERGKTRHHLLGVQPISPRLSWRVSNKYISFRDCVWHRCHAFFLSILIKSGMPVLPSRAGTPMVPVSYLLLTLKISFSVSSKH